jgi:hypothetical protein
VTSLRQRVLDELQRRNYSPATTRGYILAYYHLVFSLPHGLVPLMWQNKQRLFDHWSACRISLCRRKVPHKSTSGRKQSLSHAFGQSA